MPRTDLDLDLAALHDRALAETRRFVAGVGADRWDDRVETSSTTVRILVNHFVGESFWVEPLIAGEPGAVVRERFAGDLLGDDPVAAYDRAGASASAAFHTPGAMDAPCHISSSKPTAGAAFCGNRFVDLLVHGWEIAAATGQDATLDPDLAETARVLIEPDIVKLRANGTIKDALDIPDDASSQTKLLGFFGYEG